MNKETLSDEEIRNWRINLPIASERYLTNQQAEKALNTIEALKLSLQFWHNRDAIWVEQVEGLRARNAELEASYEKSVEYGAKLLVQNCKIEAEIRNEKIRLELQGFEQDGSAITNWNEHHDKVKQSLSTIKTETLECYRLENRVLELGLEWSKLDKFEGNLSEEEYELKGGKAAIKLGYLLTELEKLETHKEAHPEIY